jgi:CHASE3 domain sensor protein
MDNVRSYKGKRFVFLLFLGLVVFAAVMGFGTFWIANLMTPGLRARNEEAQRRANAERAGKMPPPVERP